MKLLLTILICLLFLLTVLYPAGALIFDYFGYDFTIVGVPALAFVLATLAVCLVALCFKVKLHSKLPQIILATILPLSLINSLFYLSGIFTILLLVIYVGACCFLIVKHIRLFALKAASMTLSVLLALPIGFFLFLALIFGSFGKNTVIQTLESPSGSHYAQVIDSDQGALGGDTYVEVYEKCLVDNFLIRIQKEPRRVYSGEWGEYENMKIYWISDDCLVINSVEYKI